MSTAELKELVDSLAIARRAHGRTWPHMAAHGRTWPQGARHLLV